MEDYDDIVALRRPISLGCLHRVCATCLPKLLVTKEGERVIPCPECNTKEKRPLNHIPVDFRCCEQIKEIKKLSSGAAQAMSSLWPVSHAKRMYEPEADPPTDEARCEIHPTRTLTRYCVKCQRSICNDCFSESDNGCFKHHDMCLCTAGLICLIEAEGFEEDGPDSVRAVEALAHAEEQSIAMLKRHADGMARLEAEVEKEKSDATFRYKTLMDSYDHAIETQRKHNDMLLFDFRRSMELVSRVIKDRHPMLKQTAESYASIKDKSTANPEALYWIAARVLSANETFRSGVQTCQSHARKMQLYRPDQDFERKKAIEAILRFNARKWPKEHATTGQPRTAKTDADVAAVAADAAADAAAQLAAATAAVLNADGLPIRY